MQSQPIVLIAYHNDPKIRAKYLRRVRLHAAHDEIVKGQYWEGGKGCAVGCILHSATHRAAESEIGVPEWLMRLIDGIFEALPNDQAKEFPAAFLAAIPVGSDLAPVRDLFLAWLMDDTTFGLARTGREEVRALAAEVARRLRTGEGVTGAQADELTQSLRDAWAAWAAWAAWDARAAWAARDSRAAWAAWAARDAWDARDAWAAREFVIASRDELLRLLAAAK